jgi:hypothetical protein
MFLYSHLSSGDLLNKDGCVSVRFPGLCAVEMIDSLIENFKIRFNDLHSHDTNIQISETPFSPEVSDASVD